MNRATGISFILLMVKAFFIGFFKNNLNRKTLLRKGLHLH